MSAHRPIQVDNLVVASEPEGTSEGDSGTPSPDAAVTVPADTRRGWRRLLLAAAAGALGGAAAIWLPVADFVGGRLVDLGVGEPLSEAIVAVLFVKAGVEVGLLVHLVRRASRHVQAR